MSDLKTKRIIVYVQETVAIADGLRLAESMLQDIAKGRVFDSAAYLANLDKIRSASRLAKMLEDEVIG